MSHEPRGTVNGQSCYCQGTPHSPECRLLRYADRKRKVWDVQQPRARSTDPQTSHDAAKSVRKVTETQEEILRVLRLHPEGMTDDRVWDWFRPTPGCGSSPSGVRSRRAELVKMGKVVDSGERRKLPSGRMSIVWKLAE